MKLTYNLFTFFLPVFVLGQLACSWDSSQISEAFIVTFTSFKEDGDYISTSVYITPQFKGLEQAIAQFNTSGPGFEQTNAVPSAVVTNIENNKFEAVFNDISTWTGDLVVNFLTLKNSDGSFDEVNYSVDFGDGNVEQGRMYCLGDDVSDDHFGDDEVIDPETVDWSSWALEMSSFIDGLSSFANDPSYQELISSYQGMASSLSLQAASITATGSSQTTGSTSISPTATSGSTPSSASVTTGSASSSTSGSTSGSGSATSSATTSSTSTSTAGSGPSLSEPNWILLVFGAGLLSAF